MALVTLNNLDVIEVTACIPRIGVWHADLTVDSDSALTVGDVVTLSLGSLSLSGTVVRSGAPFGANDVRVAGGKAGLARLANPKFYQGIPAKSVIADLLQTAGEGLSGTSDVAILGTLLSNWTTVQQPVSTALSALLPVFPTGTAWRILADGTLWVGPETWPTSALLYDLLDESPREARLLIGTDDPVLLPGMVLGGRRIDYVETTVAAGKVRIRAWVTE